MEAIEIARKLAALGQTEDACTAYGLAVQQGAGPMEQMEAAAYILQNGGDYRISYGCFTGLYNQGLFREDILPLMDAVFYQPNVKQLKSRYERNCKLLAKYPYLFRRDFVPFEELPIQFFPYDDHNGYVPFYRNEERFGAFVNFGNQVVGRNFFKELDKPILAADVFSQYELEYLVDNVRPSEYIGRENHIYLHYTDWGVFCAYLQCLNLRRLLESKKLVFLIGDEVEQYPIDFKERFGIDYSRYPVRPIGIREVNRMIWHTQLSTHNGGDFFNEVFDGHPNLIILDSVMFGNAEKTVADFLNILANAGTVQQAVDCTHFSNAGRVRELYYLRDRTEKDALVALFLIRDDVARTVEADSRIAPALFFQPHFSNIVYQLRAGRGNRTVLESENADAIRQSRIFRQFKYIKTFTPMRRFTTSHGATVKYMYQESLKEGDGSAPEKGTMVVSDAVMERVLNRSFMIDPEDRLYKDSVLVRLEDGKLNPKATFTALAAFLDLPYTESMTYGSKFGKPVERRLYMWEENCAPGFGAESVYRTYDEYVNDSERYFIEYFLRDAYEYYGYGFQYYDGAAVDEAKVEKLISGFTTMDHYMRETHYKLFKDAEVSQDGVRVSPEVEERVHQKLLDDHMAGYAQNRLESAKILLEGLRFVNKKGQPLRMMPKLELDEALLERPLYH